MSWLSTLQAAKRLGVSEASVRRWSDRGLLPVQRVGKRLERRFKAEHVDRFVAPAPAGPPPRSDRPRVTVAGQVVVGGGTGGVLDVRVDVVGASARGLNRDDLRRSLRQLAASATSTEMIRSGRMNRPA